MVKVDANTLTAKGPGFDFQMTMHPSASVLDPINVPLLSVHDNPLRALSVSKTAVCSLNNLLMYLCENFKEANAKYPKAAFVTCLSCWFKRTYPDKDLMANIVLYRFLIAVDAGSIMYECKNS
jgi:hypothetical protein